VNRNTESRSQKSRNSGRYQNPEKGLDLLNFMIADLSEFLLHVLQWRNSANSEFCFLFSVFPSSRCPGNKPLRIPVSFL
jgi:hypothetical protein